MAYLVVSLKPDGPSVLKATATTLGESVVVLVTLFPHFQHFSNFLGHKQFMSPVEILSHGLSVLKWIVWGIRVTYDYIM